MHRQDGQVVHPRRRRAVQARRVGRLAAVHTHSPGHELLRDIHAGVCGHHAAPRTLVGNAFRQGFYWPTAVADANEIVRTCEGCQFYARKTNLPAHALQTIPVTWPFAVWGLDIVRPLRKAPGGYTHLLVAID
jgi:hypothetical protein